MLPGAAVSVEAKADAPGSRVFFLAYDVSVALQAGGAASALTAVRALAAVAPPPPPPVTTGQGLTLVAISAQLELTLVISAQLKLALSPTQPKLIRGGVQKVLKLSSNVSDVSRRSSS